MSVSYFYIYKDNASQWRWKFNARNGKTISVSSESYHNLADCENSVQIMKLEGAAAVVIGDDSYDKLRKR
ncbi:uncharacterized protein YegP (UPF0339 family) [Comamonas odontotermitis]|uniref:Uncharacterized protein YegP (UPF0339 family) n=1 Tax=Comamonas odontotermitis TaxID=379895 RepID=A0ABR6RLV8_9BURK|nr:DUF1508 domain-containing protein [Comamonas odontotermitis]MBB6580052.1 uncharacterized protein YegP (UPF0339 family) [Comamonas odontotermitis]